MKLRHIALKGLSDTLLTSRGENKAFPPTSPPCNVVPLFELSKENNRHPTFEWRGGGRGVDSFVVSVVILFEYNVPTILLPIASHRGSAPPPQPPITATSPTVNFVA